MPKKINTAKKAANMKKNTDALSSAIASAAAGRAAPIFGRVEKPLGNGLFKIIVINKYNKPVEVQGIIRGVMRGGQNSATFVAPEMIVLLSESSSNLHEIASVISRRADLKQLKKEGLIHKMLLSADGGEDDIFEEREDEDEEADEAVGKERKERAAKSESAEVDLADL